MGKYQGYEKYKASGVEWLGEIPEHWEALRLRFILNINPSKNEMKLDKSSLASFVPMEAVGEYGGINLANEKPIEDVFNGYNYFANNDVVIAKITPCFENGKSAIAHSLTNGIAFGTTELHVLRASHILNNYFLFYLVISHLFRYLGEAEMYGAGGQKRVPENFIRNFRIGLPPLDEQEKIARFLDYKTKQIDELIAKKETLIEKLDEKRTAVISHAVTKGLDPSVPMKDSGIEWLGEIPQHWNVSKLKFTSKIIDCKNRTPEYFDNGEYFVIRTTNIRNGQFLQSNAFYTDEENFRIWTKRGIPPAGSILFTREAPAGESCLVPENIKLCLGQRVMNFIPNDNWFTEYLLFFLRTKYFFNFINSQSSGSTVTHLRLEQVYNIEVILPPQEETNKIIQYIKFETQKILNSINKISQAIALLKEYRTALITNAVTGKIDVRQVPIPSPQKPP